MISLCLPTMPGLIRMLGGDTRNLPIARSAARNSQFPRHREAARFFQNEILLHVEAWGGYEEPDLPITASRSGWEG